MNISHGTPSAPPTPAHSPRARSRRGVVEIIDDLRSLERRVDIIEHRIEIMEGIARRYRHFNHWLTRLPVSEYRERDHRFGFHYDERDGTGLDRRPALAIDTDRRNPDYIFLSSHTETPVRALPPSPGRLRNRGRADPANAKGQARQSMASRLR